MFRDGEMTVEAPGVNRPVYAGVCEVMIYVEESARGRGVGGTLLRRLVEETEELGIWTLQAGYFRKTNPRFGSLNAAVFAFSERMKRLGQFHDGRWRDVVLMQRRSLVAGID